MSTSPRSPKLLKGALIELSERFIGPVPNIILFQYNPETMTRTLEVWNPSGSGSSTGSEAAGSTGFSQTAQPHDPPESFNLVLELDAADALENPTANPVAVVSGIADRIAALELLLYPQEKTLAGGLLSSAVNALSGSSGSPASSIPERGTVPVLLFAWGPGRIVPVRLTSFSVEEQAYSPTLYPIRARVNIGMRILSSADFPKCNTTLSQDIAIAASKWTRGQKEVLADANKVNNVKSILGILPF